MSKNNKHKGGKVKGPIRHFRIAILDNKEIHRSEKGIGSAQASISMKANPIDAAKKLLSSICRHKGLKKMNRLKCNAIFSIKETTRKHSKMYGPYKGKFVNLIKNGKERIVKLRNGTIIKYRLKPYVKKYKGEIDSSLKMKVNKVMKGGFLYNNENPIILKSCNNDTILCTALMDEGTKIVSGGNNHTINISNLDGECIRTLSGHTGNITSVVVSEDGDKIVSGSSDKTIKVWNLRKENILDNSLIGHTQSVNSVVIIKNPDRIVSGSSDKTIKIWDLLNGTCIMTLTGHTYPVSSIVVTDDNIISGSNDATIKIWNLSDGKIISTLTGHTNSVNSVALFVHSIGNNKYKRIISGSSDKTIKVWDLLNGTCIMTLTGHTDWVNSVAVINKSERIISASYDKTIKIWSSVTGDCYQTLNGTFYFRTIDIIGNGEIILSSYANKIYIWKDKLIGKKIEENLVKAVFHPEWIKKISNKTGRNYNNYGNNH